MQADDRPEYALGDNRNGGLLGIAILLEDEHRSENVTAQPRVRPVDIFYFPPYVGIIRGSPPTDYGQVLGTFLAEPTNVAKERPSAHVAAQLGIRDVACMADYAARATTARAHAAEIRRIYIGEVTMA